jgi:hypothetical protein
MDGNTTITELIANGLVTLAAAFLGAWAAFKLESSDRKKQIEDDEVAAGNRALFTLVQIWSKLKQYQGEIVEDYRARPDAWLNLPVGPPVQDSALIFDMKDLSFVLEASPSTFQMIFLEQDRFRLAAYVIQERSELVLSEVFPRMSAAGLSLGEPITVGEMEKLLTVGITQQLKVFTKGIIKNVDEDVISSRETFEKLRTALKDVYPKRKFINFPKEQTAAEANVALKKT